MSLGLCVAGNRSLCRDTYYEFMTGFSKYSICFKLLVVEMDVSRTKIYLDTSIHATNNSERKEYMLRTHDATFVLN